jgi:hypothetical protein
MMIAARAATGHPVDDVLTSKPAAPGAPNPKPSTRPARHAALGSRRPRCAILTVHRVKRQPLTANGSSGG